MISLFKVYFDLLVLKEKKMCTDDHREGVKMNIILVYFNLYQIK